MSLHLHRLLPQTLKSSRFHGQVRAPLSVMWSTDRNFPIVGSDRIIDEMIFKATHTCVCPVVDSRQHFFMPTNIHRKSITCCQA